MVGGRAPRAAKTDRGGPDPPQPRRTITVEGVRVQFAGVDDPHLRRDRYNQISGPVDVRADVRLGVTHSPEPRVLDAFTADGYDLVLAGHTHLERALARRVVLDTIESLFSGLKDDAVLRAELRRLFRWLKDRGVTALITGERGDGPAR